MKLGALLLAAGGSTRMGRHKLLLPWGAGTVVGQALTALLQAEVAPSVVVVTGCNAPAVQEACQSAGGKVAYVHNPHWAEGMFSSVLAGLTALPQDLDGCFIALGDMPLIPPTLYASLAVPGSIVIPTYQDRRGHPVFFPMDLLHAPGTEGLRGLIQHHPDRVREHPVDEPGIHIDLDTPEEYIQYRPISSM